MASSVTLKPMSELQALQIGIKYVQESLILGRFFCGLGRMDPVFAISCVIEQGADSFGDALHPHEHAPDVRMLDDGHLGSGRIFHGS